MADSICTSDGDKVNCDDPSPKAKEKKARPYRAPKERDSWEIFNDWRRSLQALKDNEHHCYDDVTRTVQYLKASEFYARELAAHSMKDMRDLSCAATLLDRLVSDIDDSDDGQARRLSAILAHRLSYLHENEPRED